MTPWPPLRKGDNRKFFDARVFDLPFLARAIHSGEIEARLSKQEQQELLDVFPLYTELMDNTGKPWVIGKLTKIDHPYDVFIAPEESTIIKGKQASFREVAFVQTKRIVKYPSSTATPDEWLRILQTKLSEYFDSQRPGAPGILHFYNTVNFTQPMLDRDFADLFRKLDIRTTYKDQVVTLTLPVVDRVTNEETLRTWAIHPRAFPMSNFSETYRQATIICRRAAQKRTDDVAVQMLISRMKELGRL